MPLSMNPEARYVTQQGVYTNMGIGRLLTDKRITYYQKRGLYGNGLVMREAVQAKKKRRKPQNKIIKTILERIK